MKGCCLLSRTLFVIFLLIQTCQLICQSKYVEIIFRSNNSDLITDSVQAAIDKCSDEGGGIIHFEKGVFHSGTLQLKSNVVLQLDKGALLQGSDMYGDYKSDAFIFGKDISNFAVQGEGTIDGVNCYNPKGEEGFRGPHCIRLINCDHFTLKGFTIKNSANWAINCRNCSYASVDSISIQGGHDGLHTRFCDNFRVIGCDFRTGDDAFAGNDNRDFVISDCNVNTSCNGFRLGCLNLRVFHCRLWGPGEYIHKSQKRNNMLSAFVHFSPEDENPVLNSGNWLIEDITIENVDHFYMYNFENGLWQTGQPVTTVRFKQIRATGLLDAFSITGDSLRKFNMQIANSSFSFREGTEYNDAIFEGRKLTSTFFFNASNFNLIVLREVTFEKIGVAPVLNCNFGNYLILEDVSFVTKNSSIPYVYENIRKVKKENLKTD